MKSVRELQHGGNAAETSLEDLHDGDARDVSYSSRVVVLVSNTHAEIQIQVGSRYCRVANRIHERAASVYGVLVLQSISLRAFHSRLRDFAFGDFGAHVEEMVAKMEAASAHQFGCSFQCALHGNPMF